MAEVTVGCKDRPAMGWMTTLAGPAPSAAGRELPCGAPPASPASGWASRLLCCRVCCRTLGSIWKAAQRCALEPGPERDPGPPPTQGPRRGLHLQCDVVDAGGVDPRNLHVGPDHVGRQLQLDALQGGQTPVGQGHRPVTASCQGGQG